MTGSSSIALKTLFGIVSVDINSADNHISIIKEGVKQVGLLDEARLVRVRTLYYLALNGTYWSLDKCSVERMVVFLDRNICSAP